jgi:hypothetical protein
VHARIDLPEPDEALGVADHLTAVAASAGAEAVAVVVYGPDPDLAEEVIRALAVMCCDRGIELRAALRTDGERWYRHTVDGAVVDVVGTPYELASHPATLQAVYDGEVVHGSREDLARSLLPTSSADVEAVRAAAVDAAEAPATRSVGGAGEVQDRARLVAEARWLQRRLRTHLRDQRPLAAREVGRLVVAMTDVGVRDVAWAEMCRENARRHVTLWTDVVRRCPEELLPAPASMLAFAAWLAGDGALAWCALERCRAVDPGYSLAGLLDDALSGALPPTAWVPFDPESLPIFTEPAP